MNLNCVEEGRLLQYLRGHVAEFKGVEQLFVHKFTKGQSNPTYLLEAKEGQRVHRAVLRKKPPPPTLPSAHAIEREYLIITKLYEHGFPVPKPIIICDDDGVLGTPFYVMEFVEGDIFVSPALDSVPEEARRGVYFEMAKTLARLHCLDPMKLGLEGFGRWKGYNRRQVARWYTQFRRSMDYIHPAVQQRMENLYLHLRDRVPQGDNDESVTRITHGDFRIDNLMYNSGRRDASVAAVLDWELSTLGDPMADLAYSCLPYYISSDDIPTLGLPNPLPVGIPCMEEYVHAYCSERGAAMPVKSDWSFYVALSLFRLASILIGVQSRSLKGNASSEEAASISSDKVILALLATAHKELVGSRQAAPEVDILGTSSNESLTFVLERLRRFMESEVLPAEESLRIHAASDHRFKMVHPLIEVLKEHAKNANLWNLWIPPDLREFIVPVSKTVGEKDTHLLLGHGLSHEAYAHCAELMGYSAWGSEVFNCSAPDTGNCEVLARYGSIEQQEEWLVPLLLGEIRSCFAMTEKEVASSDARNISSSISRDRDAMEYVLNGRKWWISGACDPRCRFAIFMGVSKPSASIGIQSQQSMVLVPMPNPGITAIVPLKVYGYDDAPHGHAEMVFEDVRVPFKNMILGEGRGFEIAQGRLGPGRLHHCMRLIGHGRRGLDLCLERIGQRKSFGKLFKDHQSIRHEVAHCRIQLDAARLMVHEAARALDTLGNKRARAKVSEAKVFVPKAVLQILDKVIQIYGGGGVSEEFPLASLWTVARILQIADGPDVVHLETIARVELLRRPKL